MQECSDFPTTDENGVGKEGDMVIATFSFVREEEEGRHSETESESGCGILKAHHSSS